MFDTAHYLHYVLDTARQAHYTGDMMKLSQGAFLWHELKECHGFDGVAFLTNENQKLRLKVYDAESEQIFRQEKKGLFSSQKEVTPQIQPESFSLSELKKSDKELLRWLLERQKKAKNKKTALVCNVDALELLYRYADEKDRSMLVEEGRRKSTQGILLVNLPTEAGQLQRALGPMGCLAQLDADVAQLQQSKVRRPMLSLLEEQLTGRFTDLGNLESSIENMLLYDTLEKGDGEDSLEDIKNQARYLSLCCQFRVRTELIPDEPVTHDALAKKLRESIFRDRLRQEVAKLLKSEEGTSVEQQFRKAFRDQIDSSADLRICYADDLVSRVAALPSLEENDQIVWSLKKVPQSLCKALQTLWNLPRSEQVCDMIETCCGAIHCAYPEQDWDTVTDALLLLQLCTRYLCAPHRMDENLKELFQSAEEVLNLSFECFRLGKDQQQFRQIHQGKTDALSRLQDKIYDGSKTLEQNIYYLKVKRADLHDKIVFFNAQERNPEEISAFLSKKLQQLGQKKEQEQKVQEAIDDTKQALTSVPEKPVTPLWETEEPPVEKRKIDWSVLIGPRPWELDDSVEKVEIREEDRSEDRSRESDDLSLPQEEDDPFDFG